MLGLHTGPFAPALLAWTRAMPEIATTNSKEAPLRLSQDKQSDSEANPVHRDSTASDDGPGAAAPEGASELSSIFNLSNSILGSGTLAMPYACHQCGVVMFVVLLGIVGAIANFSLNLVRAIVGLPNAHALR